MAKKLKKKKHHNIKRNNFSLKCPKSIGGTLPSAPTYKSNILVNQNKKLEKKQKRKEQTKVKLYTKKIFNNYAFPDKPVVDCGIINKKNYNVVAVQNPNKLTREYYYSKTLFKTNKKGEIKQS